MNRDYPPNPQDDQELLTAINRGLQYLEYIPDCAFTEVELHMAWVNARYYVTNKAAKRLFR